MSKIHYEFLDSGNGRKLERFGQFVLSRPCSQAVWQKQLPEEIWKKADAIFTREEENRWIKRAELPQQWFCDVEGIQFKIQPTDFGHLGIFPEQHTYWRWMRDLLQKTIKEKTLPHRPKVLNLFAYSGGSTMASAHAGAEVCHLDASKGMVAWARENAAKNNLTDAPIRWIVDDVLKFLQREIKRQNRYDAIILDPPTFGRGAQGELFKIEEHIIQLLDMCMQVLSPTPLFILFSCHTPGFSPQVLDNLLSPLTKHLKGHLDNGEMLLQAKNSPPLPSGAFARWQR
jgi:23S rRNA (cytosine1962-C5)-methyltransferase